MSANVTIGILALQGAFDLHAKALSRLGVTHRLVKTAADLNQLDGLIIPGGESTTMRWLMDAEGMTAVFAQFVRTKPVMGTCAGMILLARTIVDGNLVQGFGAIDIDVRRNAYGRQVHSHVVRGEINLGGGVQAFEMVFIRAPRITRVGTGVQVLGAREGEPVMVAQGNVLSMSFHPELSGSAEIHRWFVDRFVRTSPLSGGNSPSHRNLEPKGILARSHE